VPKYKPGDNVVINNKCLMTEWIGLRGTIISTDGFNICQIKMFDGDDLYLDEVKLDIVTVSPVDDNGGLSLL